MSAMATNGNNPVLEALREAVDFSQVHHVPLDKIVRNEAQPRTDFDEVEMLDLIKSIKELGQKDTAFVLPQNDGTYLMVSGERRWRAMKRAFLHTMRVHFCRRALTASETYLLSCYGNARQVEQSTYDNVVMVRELLQKKLGHEQIAALVSRSVSWVDEHANVAAHLDAEVFEMMRGNREKTDRLTLEEALRILSMAPDMQVVAAGVILAAKKKGGGKASQKTAFQVFVESSGVRNSRGHTAKRTVNGQLLGMFARHVRDLESFAAAPEGAFLSNLRQSGLVFLTELLEAIDGKKKSMGVIKRAFENLPLLELAALVKQADGHDASLRNLVERARNMLQEKQ